MARFIKIKRESIGLSPDAYLLRGEKKSDITKIRTIKYNSDNIEEFDHENIGDLSSIDLVGHKAWVNIDGLHDIEIMERISDIFNLDSLIIPDVLNTYSRPKFQEYESCLYFSMKMLKYDDETDRISSENLVMVLSKDRLLSFQEKVGDVFEPVRERLRKSKKRIRNLGPDYLGYALIDVVIDNYIYVISRMGDKIESLDEELIRDSSNSILNKINNYKSEVIFLRKSIKPCLEMIINFSKSESEFISQNIKVHQKELLDNIKLANELLDSYREILSEQVNVFHTNVSSKLNEILKTLTIFSVIFIPLTFVAGIYGTNFDNIPELHYPYSYFIMIVSMLIMALGMVYYFKRKKWF